MDLKDKEATLKSAKELDFYKCSLDIFDSHKFYLKKIKTSKSPKLIELRSIQDIKVYLLKVMGKQKYNNIIEKGQSTAGMVLGEYGFEVKDRNRFSENFKKSSKDKNKTNEIYISLGKYYLVYEEGRNKGKPVIVNNKRIEADTKGELMRFIHSTLALKDAQQPNILSNNGIRERLFSIKRDVFEVEKGYHSRVIKE